MRTHVVRRQAEVVVKNTEYPAPRSFPYLEIRNFVDPMIIKMTFLKVYCEKTRKSVFKNVNKNSANITFNVGCTFTTFSNISQLTSIYTGHTEENFETFHSFCDFVKTKKKKIFCSHKVINFIKLANFLK